MKKYLVLTREEVDYADTDAQACTKANVPSWESRPVMDKLNAMNPGDQLDLTSSTAIIKLSGVTTR